MSVHKKIVVARKRLQDMQLKKSGLNKFAGFQYFELSDFLPAINNICYDLGLCGTVNFTKEEATLTITDTEDSSNVVFTCPVVEVSLKGCIPVQGLGAGISYIRRYLWVNAFEITEHDAVDATSGKDIHKPTDNPLFNPDSEELEYLQDICMNVVAKTSFDEMANYLEELKLDSDEKVWVWDKLDSKTRSGIKKANAERKVAA